MSDPSASTSEVLAALPTLESSLATLTKQPWSETLDGLDTLERAKMDILMSYAINDLIWVYLKLKGIDPAEHEVSSELERIKKYYAKIRQVEEPQARKADQRSTKVDAAAARRFILGSIPASQRNDPPSTSAAALAQQQADDAMGESRMSSRFRFLAKDAERVVLGNEDEEGSEDTPDTASGEIDKFMSELDRELNKQDGEAATGSQADPAEATDVVEASSGRKRRRKEPKEGRAKGERKA